MFDKNLVIITNLIAYKISDQQSFYHLSLLRPLLHQCARLYILLMNVQQHLHQVQVVAKNITLITY